MKQKFLYIAGSLNKKLHILPLLFGSLGLEQRLHISLNADDIDILIPDIFLHDRWDDLVDVMAQSGYTLCDLHEHTFEKAGVSISFAAIESLMPFAGVDPKNIPVIQEADVRYYLLELQDYRKVYTASSKDGYRKNIKNKKDEEKIALINKAIEQSGV